LPHPPADRDRLPDPGVAPGLARADQVYDRDGGDDRDLPRELPGVRTIHGRRRGAQRPARTTCSNPRLDLTSKNTKDTKRNFFFVSFVVEESHSLIAATASD